MLKIENGKPVVYKESKTMGTLIMKEIPKALAKDMCIKYHYAHKWNGASFGTINIGIFRANEPSKCLGVASFGSLMHPKSYTMFSDDIKQDEILELNRLWIDDCLGKNSETMLLSASWIILRYYKKVKVIQSFADGRLGCGTIYKASNFKFYGYEERAHFLENQDTKEITFENTVSDINKPLCLVSFWNTFTQHPYKCFIARSYRYIYTLDKSVKIKLKEQPYPEYNKGVTYLDMEELMSKGLFKNCVFKSFLISKYVKNVDDSTYNIANYLLTNYTNENINETYDNLLLKSNNIKNVFGETMWFQNLIKKRNYIELLKEDANNKPQKVVYEDLF